MKVGTRVPVIDMNCFLNGSSKQKKQIDEIHQISQYTSIDALISILQNKEIKANSIQNVDDVMEQRYLQFLIDEDEAIPYIACFDKSEEENIALWHMYTQESEGIRIRFNLSNKMSSLLDQTKPVRGYSKGSDRPVPFVHSIPIENKNYDYPKVFAKIEASAVEYINKGDPFPAPLPANNLTNISVLASFKDKGWNFQNEVRFILYFDHVDHTADNDKVDIVNIPRFDYFLIPLQFEALECIEITFSPWMGRNVKEMLKSYLSVFNLGCKIIFKDSKYDGTINRK